MKKMKNKILIGSSLFLTSISILSVTSCETLDVNKITKQIKSTIKKAKEKIKIMGISPKKSQLISGVSLEMWNADPIITSTIVQVFDGIDVNKWEKQFKVIKKVGSPSNTGIIILQARDGFVFENESLTLLSNQFTFSKKTPVTVVDTTSTPSPDITKVTTEGKDITSKEDTITDPNPKQDNDSSKDTTTPIKNIELTKAKVLEWGWNKERSITKEMFEEKMPGVTSIGEKAFNGANLHKIDLPETVVSIGLRAFSNTLIRDLVIPDSVKTIGNAAFSDNVINNFNLPFKFNNFDEKMRIGVYKIFVDTKLNKQLVKKSFLGMNDKITKKMFQTQFPNIDTIEEGAFEEKNLNLLELPEGIIRIGKRAFRRCQLVNLIIPKSVKHIEQEAFYGNKISSLFLNNSLITIGESAFAYNSLKEITIPNTMTIIEKGTFAYNSLSSLTIPKSIIYIRDYAFQNNELTELVVPKTVKQIGAHAFSKNKLESIEIDPSTKVNATYNENQRLEIS